MMPIEIAIIITGIDVGIALLVFIWAITKISGGNHD